MSGDDSDLGADDDDSDQDASDGASTVGWPLEPSGVSETVVTTLGPNGLWNVAALGVFAGDPATARTWGKTRTRRNFERRGEGYVQFTRDPVDFVDAALSITEREDPILESADAWARVAVERVETGTDDGTDWAAWTLEPRESTVVRESVTPINRGFGAVIEATVAASRLGVEGYDRSRLEGLLEHCLEVVGRAGGARERVAFANLVAYSEWEPSPRARDENEWL
ncbi:DUF447 domain-containing protein [Natronosalvus halobius]|uniref:DUF447 domain-containing protein n=1 Tax=Natronosalvus halobius TaxID=2953746 RepID=UPI00209D511F|nr:DUF447 domain-containing protein [Natronosalvus halobius]USZ72165.1 DUF447 family protein [Natronosalvus halobius]